jgi:hypothetical protein
MTLQPNKQLRYENQEGEVSVKSYFINERANKLDRMNELRLEKYGSKKVTDVSEERTASIFRVEE